jgi:predicted Zn finger-like uncharacterized protein
LSDSDLSYTFTCPSCAGSFSILLERVPPVQARFRCPHCKQPMDFPSRDEARVYARLQAEGNAAPATPGAAAATGSTPTPPPVPVRPTHSPVSSDNPAARTTTTLTMEEPANPNEIVRIRVAKTGFEADVYDRRALRNLIRAGEIDENDKLHLDDGPPIAAGDVPFLKSLFSLRKTARVTPPVCCRTHTDRVAHFKCRENNRPLCEDCAPEKKFGGTTIRVCNHCGGTATEMVQPGL